MKSLWSAVVIVFAMSQSAFASDGAVYNAKIQRIVKAEKVGQATYTVDGKSKLKSSRRCALVVTDFATESFDRDMLTIAFDGDKPLANNLGINAHGSYVGNEVFWDGPLFYDSVTSEKALKLKDGAFGFEFCVAETDKNSAFANNCDEAGAKKSYVMRIVVEKRKITMTEEDYKKNAINKTTEVTCSFKKDLF